MVPQTLEDETMKNVFLTAEDIFVTAASNGDCKKMQETITKTNFDVDEAHIKQLDNPITWASRGNHLPAIKLLVEEHSIDPNLASKDAVDKLNLPRIKYLVEQGANPNKM